MQHKLIESRNGLILVVAMLLSVPGNVSAQHTNGIVARMLFPPRNFEILLGDTIVPTVRVINTGTVIDTGIKVWFRYSNVSWPNNTAVYSSKISVPNLAPGDSIDLSFAAYASNPNIISELGTFTGCLTTLDTVPLTTTCSSMFAIRRTSVPFFDPSDGYSKAYVGNYSIPDQTMWVSLGATVVDGEDSTWDPPPPRYSLPGVGPDSMISPVIRLDRLDYNGNFYSGTGVGDTLTSFPIYLGGKPSVFFYFDYMRAGRHRYPLGWDDSVMFGPENTITEKGGNVIRAGDSLILEFEKPSGPVTNPGPNDWNEIAAIDGGHDFEYKRFSAHPDSSGLQLTIDGITKELRDTTNYFTPDFRFRLRLKANNDASQNAPPVDDADQWYIDNLMLGFPLVPEYELRWVRVANPYTKVPLSQSDFPIFLNLGIIDLGSSLDLPLEVDIINPFGDTVYSQFVDIPSYYGVDTTIQFPNWDASGEPGNDTGAYSVIAQIAQANFQNYNTTETYSKFYLNTESGDTAIQEFALDDAGMNPAPGVGNNIPKLTGVPGSGIGFDHMKGSFAMDFYLGHYDSVAGVRLYFGSANPSPDIVSIGFWSGSPDNNSPLASFFALRDTAHLDQFSSYYFPQPVPLPGGVSYWISVSQVEIDNMELGASVSRGGEQIVRENATSPQISPIYTSPYGTQWGSGAADNNGNPINAFEVETGNGNDNWIPFSAAMSSTDDIQPMLHIGDTSPWIGAGTYIPMIRPILGAVPSQSSVSTFPAAPSFALEQNYPNPFNPTSTSTTISFTLDVPGLTSITVSNILGDVVKKLVNAPEAAGSHVAVWDGKDENGSFAPAGTYLITLTSNGRRVTEKMIVTQ